MNEKDFDWTARMGPLWPLPASTDIPMYSFEKPAWLFWNGLAEALSAAGWSEERIKEWLQGKTARWFLDSYGERVTQLGRDLAAEVLKEIPRV